jgi:hypothetical protein
MICVALSHDVQTQQSVDEVTSGKRLLGRAHHASFRASGLQQRKWTGSSLEKTAPAGRPGPRPVQVKF